MLTVKYSSAYCSAEVTSARASGDGGSLQDAELCSPGGPVLCTLDNPGSSGEATAIGAMRELCLGTALETRSASIASPKGVNKHHALGKIIISWMKKRKKKKAFLTSTVYFCSKLLFVNPVLSKMGVAESLLCTFHVGKREKQNQAVYLGRAALPPCWPNLPCRLRKTAKGQAGRQTAILYRLVPASERVQLQGRFALSETVMHTVQTTGCSIWLMMCGKALCLHLVSSQQGLSFLTESWSPKLTSFKPPFNTRDTHRKTSCLSTFLQMSIPEPPTCWQHWTVWAHIFHLNLSSTAPHVAPQYCGLCPSFENWLDN